MNVISFARRGGNAKNVLLAVRPDRDTDWAVNFVTQLYRRTPLELHLLSVQTPFTGHVRLFFDEATVAALHREDGEAELAPVKQALERAGVPCMSHVEVGFSAPVIAEFARAHDCGQVVIGPPRTGLMSRVLLGSLTEQVSHLMRSAGWPCEVV